MKQVALTVTALTAPLVFPHFKSKQKIIKMSFAEPKRIIQEGDSVILYLSVINMHILEVKSKIPSNRGVLVNIAVFLV